MCGIAGVHHQDREAPVAPELIEAMSTAQAHRGPDGDGTFIDPGIALGHRRLAIIDRGGGHQPLFNEDGSVVVVLNGEIYNYRDLTIELTRAGHTFRTQSDTEVLVHAWEQWGADCVQRLQGMFAFALWDRRAERLFLARDRLGIKPLYYATVPGGPLLFASELKALRCHPDLPVALEPRAIEEYFAFGYIPDPRTILQHAFKLPPGHTLTIDRDGAPPVPQRYWDISFASIQAVSEGDAIEALTGALDESVRSHLIAEVPLGAFLSGGVDSSTVVAAMSRVSDTPVNTCSIAFNHADFDESVHSAEVARRFGTRHHVERVDVEDFDLIERLGQIYDEPFADPSALPTYRLCELARKQVTVALSGDGGDEVFAGYDWYRGHLRREALRRRLPEPARRLLLGVLRHGPSTASAKRLRGALGKLALDPVSGFACSTMMTTAAGRDALFANDLRRALGGYRADEVVHRHAANADTDDPLALAQYIDMKLYLPADILTKVDRASMAHSLEVRVPLLDHHFVEWATTLPTRLKVHRRSGKYILKKATERSVPPNVLHRRKMGFSMPLASWFRGPLRHRLDALAAPDGTLASTGLLRPEIIGDLTREHMGGRANHETVLWALLTFERSFEALSNHQAIVEPEAPRLRITS